MLKIGLDLDQTIDDFWGPYLDRFGPPKTDSEVTRNVMRILSKDREFWLNLPVLRRPNFVPALYCTARVNNKAWTKKYLEINNFPKAPVYQVPGYAATKAPRIKGRVDVFIDDSVRNFRELNSKGIPCLLMDAENNRHIDTILRVHTLNIEEIEYVYNTGQQSGLFEKFNKIFNDEIKRN